jgi:hypothetical protein
MGTGGGRCSSNSDRLNPKFERNNISSYAGAGVLSSLSLLWQEAQKKYVGRVPQLRRVCRDRMLRGCHGAGNASQSPTLSRITYPLVLLSSGRVSVTKLRGSRFLFDHFGLVAWGCQAGRTPQDRSSVDRSDPSFLERLGNGPLVDRYTIQNFTFGS